MFTTSSSTPTFDDARPAVGPGGQHPPADWPVAAGPAAAADWQLTPTAGATVRVSRRELFAITSQLAIMSRAGTDMASALETLARQARRDAVKSMLQQIHADIVGGKSVSESLGRFEKIFGSTFVATVAAGEASGRLTEILSELARLLRGEIRLRNSIQAMLAYPILLTTVSAIVLAALVFIVLPQFAEVFDEFGMPLPAITRLFLAISSELSHRMWLWGGLALAAVAALANLRFGQTGSVLWDRLLLNGVLVRGATRSLWIGRTCRLLGITISSGVPLVESLRLARGAVRNSLYRDLLLRLEQEVTHGRQLAESLLASPFVPAAAAEMIATAERTGSLATVLTLIGEHYEEEGEAALRTLIAILEPFIIVIMGAVVAAIVLSVMLPVFDISTLGGYQ